MEELRTACEGAVSNTYKRFAEIDAKNQRFIQDISEVLDGKRRIEDIVSGF